MTKFLFTTAGVAAVLTLLSGGRRQRPFPADGAYLRALADVHDYCPDDYMRLCTKAGTEMEDAPKGLQVQARRLATLLVRRFGKKLAKRFFPEPAATANDRTLRDELRRAARARPYLLLNAAFFVCGFHVTFIGAYLPKYGEDLGHKGTATTALALIGLFNVFGSLAAGALGGRYSKTKLLGGIYAARAVVIAAYVLLPASPTYTLLFGAAIGLLWLSTVPLTSGMVTEQFGTTHSGALFGIVFFSHQLGAFAGALGGSWAHDRYGSYDLVWWIAVALGVADRKSVV